MTTEPISTERAKKMGEEDAEIAIRIARERPLGKTPDPGELRVPHPSEYRDSPELPARRIATEWDDYLNDRREEYAIELGIEPPSAPPAISRFGHGKTLFKYGDEAAWSAYDDAFNDRLEEAEVLSVLTIYPVYADDDDPDSYDEIHSVYVSDLTRYEPGSGPTLPSTEYEGDEQFALLEDHVQETFIPRAHRHRRKRKARRRS